MLIRVKNKIIGLITHRIQAINITTFIVVVSFTTSSIATSAESDIANAPTMTPKTELKIKLSKLVSYSASFSQSISDITGKELQKSSGKLTLKTPNMLRWETQSPDESLLIADGTTVYNVDPFVEQVTVIKQASITQNNPLMLLISDDQKQWDAVAVEKSQSRFVVISKDQNANIVSLIIEFDGDQLARLQSTDRQEQRSSLVFSNIAQNELVALSLFTFDIPTNYIIDDQRN